MPEFMDPTTDFGFKKLFGDEANADLTISFLNDLLELNPPLVDLSFANLEQLPEAPEQRIGVYDLLKNVYCIAIVGYPAPGSTITTNHNSIRNDRPPHAPFYDKLKFVTVELAAFDPGKPEYSLDRHLNRWLYFLKYASSLDEVPAIFKNDRIMQKAFWIAALANFTEKERLQYEHNLKRLRDAYAIWETYHEDGRAKGLEEGRAKGLQEGIAKGLEEGRIEGEIKGKIETLLLLFSQKLGPMPAEIEAAIRALNDADRVQAVLAQFLQINNWEELQKILSPHES